MSDTTGPNPSPDMNDGDVARDSETTVADLRQMIRQFVDERDWRTFHSPKNLSMALSIEVAELMEHFQWITADDSRRISDDPQAFALVKEELADVLCYGLAIANELEIDVASTMKAKMVKNRLKYPAP